MKTWQQKAEDEAQKYIKARDQTGKPTCMFTTAARQKINKKNINSKTTYYEMYIHFLKNWHAKKERTAYQTLVLMHITQHYTDASLSYPVRDHISDFCDCKMTTQTDIIHLDAAGNPINLRLFARYSSLRYTPKATDFLNIPTEIKLHHRV